MSDRLVITGCGVVGPAGQGIDTLWRAVSSGLALHAMPDQPPLGLPPHPVGRLPADVEPALAWPRYRVASLMLLAAREAIAQARWDHAALADPQTALCGATSKGDIAALLACREQTLAGQGVPVAPRAVPPTDRPSGMPADGCSNCSSTVITPASTMPAESVFNCSSTVIHRSAGQRPRWRSAAGVCSDPIFEGCSSGAPTSFLLSLPDGPSRLLADRLGMSGPHICPVAACATGTHALIRAAQLLRDGDARRAIVVAADASITPLILAAFANMGVLTADACRPFDRDRSGFFVSEGAAAITLERADDPAGRPIVELAGWLTGADPSGLTAQDSTGQSLAGCITRLLARCRISPRQVALYSAHGTATESNDLTEAAAVRLAFGQHVGRVNVLAAKAIVGHLLGAAGLTEAVLAIQAVARGMVPPVPTLRSLDPRCSLRIATRPTPADLPAAVCASLGFGGQIGLLAFRRPGSRTQ